MRTALLLLAGASLLGCPSEKAAAPAPSTTPPSPVARAAAPAPSGPRTSLTGKIVIDGEVPKLAPLATAGSVTATCGDAVEDPSLEAGPEGGLAGVVVSLDVPADGQTGPFEETVIDQRRCVYRPASVAARAGSTVALVNSDPLLHNVRAALGSRSLFNVAMPIEGMQVKKKLPPTPGVVELRCDVHPWMHAVVKTFAHPYFAVTDEKGEFTLANVPVGAHKVKVWHPRLGEELTREVSLSEGAPARLEVTVPVKDLTTEPLADKH